MHITNNRINIYSFICRRGHFKLYVICIFTAVLLYRKPIGVFSVLKYVLVVCPFGITMCNACLVTQTGVCAYEFVCVCIYIYMCVCVIVRIKISLYIRVFLETIVYGDVYRVALYIGWRYIYRLQL